jgi:hypothetical protein
MSAWRVLIPGWQPTKLNRLMTSHWRAADRLKQKDCEMIAFCCKLAGVPKIGLTLGDKQALRLQRLPTEASRLTSARKRSIQLHVVLAGRGRNPDSADCWQKSCLDGLVNAGYLTDDGDRWCQWIPPIVERGREKSTTIIITDL